MYKWYRLIGLLVIFSTLAAACSQHQGKSVQPEPLRIGLISGLSGQYASVGENYKNGVVMASEDWQRESPENKVQLFIEDDHYNEKTGLTAYTKLVSVNHIQGLVNLSSPTINSTYDRVIRDGIPVLQLGEQARDPADDNIFQILPGNIPAERGMGEYAKDQGLQNITLVYTNNDTLLRFAQAFKQGYGSNTRDFVLDPADKDFRSTIAKISESNPPAIAIITFPEQGALFTKKYKEIAGAKPRFIFDANFQSGLKDYQRILGDLSILQNDIVIGIDQTTDQDFVQRYKQRFGVEPGFGSDLGYDAFRVLVSTYSPDKLTWAGNIKSINNEGMSGLIKFDETGIREPQFRAKIIQNGNLIDL